MPLSDCARRIVCRCALAAALLIAATPAASAQDDVTAMAVSVAEEWLGPRRSTGAVDHATQLVWQGPGAMIGEARSAERIVRSWWPATVADSQAHGMLDGFARYLQTHIIERLYDRRHLRLAYSAESLSYFGGHVVWSVPPVRLSRHAALRGDRDAAVFATLERWIGVPALQAAMFEVAHSPDTRLTGAEIVKTVSDAAGQDLSWAFDAARADVNYAVTGLVSSPAADCGSPCFDSAVTVARAGGVETGAALEIKMMFEGGGSAAASWDGRDPSRTFRFRGPAPATAAYLDPRRGVTLDGNWLDNASVTPKPTNVPVRKWVARWLVWLQHTMIAYGFLG